MKDWYPNAHKRLAIELLKNALNDLAKGSGVQQRLAYKWLFENEDAPITLEQVCEWLDIDRSIVRKRAGHAYFLGEGVKVSGIRKTKEVEV